jgi:transposase
VEVPAGCDGPLALLWEEYRAAHPDGFGYSWFSEHYDALNRGFPSYL